MRSMNKICNPRAKTHALTHNAASHLFNESHSALESTFLVAPVREIPDYGFFSSTLKLVH